MNQLALFLKLLRPHQWVKSGFVFVGLLFGHVWNNGPVVHQVLLAAVAFSLAASAIYVFNDMVDRERDREHPEKRRRPLASGQVSPTQALLLAGACLIVALVFAAAASLAVLAIVSAYVLLNVAYSLRLKYIVLLDVFIVATGFMLRILAGTLGVGIAFTGLAGYLWYKEISKGERTADRTATTRGLDSLVAAPAVGTDYVGGAAMIKF